jgi:hypothetical protein
MRRLAALVLLVALAGCSGDSGEDADASPSAGSEPVTFDPELRDELVAMMDEDQAEMTGQSATMNSDARIARLKEIIDEHGWPTYDLVGEKGEEAAWVIAQHADLDLEFQQQALELLREAVADGQASPGNLAYLEDRVAVAQGEPQTYGTQVGCRRKGPVPATPIKDEAGLEERRKEAGLDPYTDYVAEMTEICAQP